MADDVSIFDGMYQRAQSKKDYLFETITKFMSGEPVTLTQNFAPPKKMRKAIMQDAELFSLVKQHLWPGRRGAGMGGIRFDDYMMRKLFDALFSSLETENELVFAALVAISFFYGNSAKKSVWKGEELLMILQSLVKAGLNLNTQHDLNDPDIYVLPGILYMNEEQPWTSIFDLCVKVVGNFLSRFYDPSSQAKAREENQIDNFLYELDILRPVTKSANKSASASASAAQIRQALIRARGDPKAAAAMIMASGRIQDTYKGTKWEEIANEFGNEERFDQDALGELIVRAKQSRIADPWQAFGNAEKKYPDLYDRLYSRA
jgi:hypothetical protein